MNPSPEQHGEAQIAFAERLLTLLDEGSFATTYKFAVLLALIDCCLEHADANGRPPVVLYTAQLAERVLTLYWPHAIEFPGAPAGEVLRQSNTGQAEIVSLIRHLRTSALLPPGATLAEARSVAPAAFHRLLRDVEWKLIEMPLPRLQRVGATVVPFLYTIGWDDSVRKSDFTHHRRNFDIELEPDAAENLVRLAGVVRPLVQRLWAARVAHYNRTFISDSGLERFLFASDRLATVRLRLALTELQDGRCFYTGRPLSRPGEVDHFLPWARYANDAIENLVVASREANADKRAFLASDEHIVRWRERNEHFGLELEHIASGARWETRPMETLNLARAIYLRLPDGIELWREGRLFVASRRSDLTQALA